MSTFYAMLVLDTVPDQVWRGLIFHMFAYPIQLHVLLTHEWLHEELVQHWSSVHLTRMLMPADNVQVEAYAPLFQRQIDLLASSQSQSWHSTHLACFCILLNILHRLNRYLAR